MKKNASFLSNIEKKIMDYPKGKKLGKLLSDLTICPVGNGSCTEILDLVIREFYADQDDKFKFEDHHLWLCGCGCDEDNCRLNK